MKTYLLFLIFILVSSSAFSQQNLHPKLSVEDITLLKEVFNFNKNLGQKLWTDWESSDSPLLFKRGKYDFLINHPSPTKEFKSYFDEVLDRKVFYKTSTDSNFYLAAYPAVDFKWTVVISKPDSTYNPYEWVLKANHELFHIYQNKKNRERIINPFINEHSNEHELSFPFAYDDEVLNSALRLEAEILFNFLKNDKMTQGEVKVLGRILDDIKNVQNNILKDTLHYQFKLWMEWNEGIARYTEFKLAKLAAENYLPTKDFKNLYPEYSYFKLCEEKYKNSTNAIRFVGEGVTGRIMFYYLGLAKGLILDKIFPEWRNYYWKLGLDEIIKKNLN